MSENEYTMPDGTVARLIPGFPAYAVTREGEVWSRNNNRWGTCDRWHKLRLQVSKRGYPQVSIGGEKRNVHAFVLAAFVGPCPGGCECRHMDGDKTNNSLGNIEWGTASENQMDRVRHGTSNRGEGHGASVLTAEIVSAMRAAARSGRRLKDIAKEFGFSSRTVLPAVRGMTWNHVPGAVPSPGKNGEYQSTAKLTDAIVLGMRDAVRSGSRLADTASRFGVNYVTACGAIRGSSWKHLPGAVPSTRRSGGSA